jgi:Tol biopolymer transport system component
MNSLSVNSCDSNSAPRHACVAVALCVSVLCIAALIPPAIIGQRRAPANVGVNATPDALAFGDRNWIYYLAANSTVPRKLAKGNFPALSPDRQRVAYCLPIDNAVSAPATGTLMLLDLSTGKGTVILKANAWIAHLRWSTNGDRLSLTLAYPNGKRELDTIAPDGSQKQTLVGAEIGADDIFNPAWAPDGQSLYFHDMSNLFQVSTSGKLLAKTPLGVIVEEKEAVTSADSFLPCPKDANLLAFTKSVPGTRLFEKTFGEQNTAIFIYDLRAKTRKRLTPVDLLAMDPVWSRDGNFIYFSGYRDREGRAAYPFKIYRIARDGTGLVQIAVGETPDT